MARDFLPIETFRGSAHQYSLLPFRFVRMSPSQELIVNDAGEFEFVDVGTVAQLEAGTLAPGTPLYKTLKAKHFLSDTDSSPLLEVLAAKYRTKKSFFFGGPRLHIFVVTLRCEHACHYCQVSRQTTDRIAYDMSPESATRSIDLMFRSPARHLTMEFQGGEPLLAFDRIRVMTDDARERATATGKRLTVVIATTLSQANDEMLRWVRDNGVLLSTSLDGPEFIHNANRPRPGGDSYAVTIRGIKRARDIAGFDRVSALMTTTRLSLNHPVEIIDEYVRQGFRSIFLRPISPYGFALKSRPRTGYDTESFLAFYRKGLEHIIGLNRAGTDLSETFATILLTKILTPYPTAYVDLQSPAGAAFGTRVYNYDGDVYASDESRMLAAMGDATFKLGNVHASSDNELMDSPAGRALIAAGCNETLAGCDECAFQPYCGADPVFHYAAQGDIFGNRPTSSFCRKNMEILKLLFRHIATGDRDLMRIFFAWIRNISLRGLGQQVPQ